MRLRAFAPAVLAAAMVALPGVALPGTARAKAFGGIVRDVPIGAHVQIAAPSSVQIAAPSSVQIAPPSNGQTASPSTAHTARATRLSPETDLPYNGGPVLHSNRTHPIFWEPAGSGLTFDAGYESLIETFLMDVAADSHKTTNVYSLSGQYADRSGPAAYDSTYGGAVVVTDPLPQSGCTEPTTGPGWTVCLTDTQLETEIMHVVAAEHLPTTNRDVYFLITPAGFGSCTDASSSSCALGGSVSGYCGYHSETPNGILYAVIPFNAVPGHCQSNNPRPNSSTADPTISTISHEHNEMVTDPDGDAWVDGAGEEDGDLCLTSFGPSLSGPGGTAWNETIHGGHFFLQEEWSNADSACEPRARPDSVAFGAVRAAGRARTLSFTGRGSDPSGRIASFEWFFGDGRVAFGRRVSHTFKTPGSYRVMLRATDSWGNWAYAARTVRAKATPAPSGH